MSTTSSVMANPNTPSLNPSIRSLLRTRRPRGVSASADMACLLRADGQAVAIFNLGRLWIAPVAVLRTIAHDMNDVTVTCTCMSAGLAGSQIFRELGWAAWASASGLFRAVAVPGCRRPRRMAAFHVLGVFLLPGRWAGSGWNAIRQSPGEPGHGVAHPGMTAATEGRELQVNGLICKPICKPDASRQHDTGETEPTERDVICCSRGIPGRCHGHSPGRDGRDDPGHN